MGKLIKTTAEYPLVEVVLNIIMNKFSIPISEEILIKNGWECNKENYWYPIIDNESEEYDEDFDCFSIWYDISKGVWCYRYSFGTYIYDIKSIGELELILGREGFVYEFEI